MRINPWVKTMTPFVDNVEKRIVREQEGDRG